MISTAGPAGLLAYNTQMRLLHQLDPDLLRVVGLAPQTVDLLCATLAHLNTLPRAGEQSPLGRWLAMAVEVAESRGYAGPYRRRIEVISGAEYRSTDDLDADSSRFPRIGKVPEGMLTVGFLSQGLAAAASICRIKVYLYRDGQRQRFEDGSPAFTLATGWLATPSLLVTAWHALAGNDRRPELADMPTRPRTWRANSTSRRTSRPAW